jgi:hypothetical protein
LATYKLTISNVNHNFVNKVFYGQAILNLLCAKNNITIDHTSPSSIVTSKFNLPKGTDLQAYIDQLLNSPANPWDAKMKDTALIHRKRSEVTIGEDVEPKLCDNKWLCVKVINERAKQINYSIEIVAFRVIEIRNNLTSIISGISTLIAICSLPSYRTILNC